MPDTPAVRLRELGWAAFGGECRPALRQLRAVHFFVQLTPEGLGHRDAITTMLLGYVDIAQQVSTIAPRSGYMANGFVSENG